MHIPQEIKDEYFKKRLNAEDRLREREAEIYALAPKYSELSRQIAQLAYDMGFKALDNKLDYVQVCEETKKKIASLRKKQITMLANFGYSPDYLTIKYECSECNDTGYTDWANGTMCRCIKKRILEYSYATSNLDNGENFTTFSIDAFTDPIHKKWMKKLHKYSIEYAEQLPHTSPINLVIIGETGTGKTFMLNCIAHRAIERNLNVYKVTAYNLIDSIMKSIKNDSKEPDYVSYDFLVIDDLGSEPMLKNITIERLFSIINEREALNKPTAIATNLFPDDIMERYGERIYSRILSNKFSTVFEISGTDIRLTSK